MTPETQLGLMFVSKKYGIILLAGCGGALAHALEQVKKSGWRGWLSFFSDILVCLFFGQVFYQVAILYRPEYAIFATSLGAYWGAKSFEYLKGWLISSIRANLPK